MQLRQPKCNHQHDHLRRGDSRPVNNHNNSHHNNTRNSFHHNNNFNNTRPSSRCNNTRLSSLYKNTHRKNHRSSFPPNSRNSQHGANHLSPGHLKPAKTTVPFAVSKQLPGNTIIS